MLIGGVLALDLVNFNGTPVVEGADCIKIFDDCLVPAYNVKRLKGIVTVEGTVQSLLYQLRCSSSKECRIIDN